ncbi:acyltransferase [Mucilaginibacter sp. HMF5004]|uniref:acyltransferase family protein n=1 Tax=Mucilaginibacter rivuli TaxID=2857527 RepID=UPI001C5F8D2C|nr:acyltransferase [Mucilaginibacter rivuli]MBW4888442.1 acyltransferase [Mucilaginibacter rivuli]
MQNLIDNTPAKKNYAFIDSIRGLAMISIVAEHSMFIYPTSFQPHDLTGVLSFAFIIQLTKFGTISFFLLAGFLIGEKFSTSSAWEYLKKRIKNTLFPWLFWSLIFLFTIVLGNVVAAFKFGNGHMDADYADQFIDHVKMVYLHSSYWFIPNFLCCITILLLFKRYLYSYYLGAVFLLFTLLYAVNIYVGWVEPRHTTALLGFVFFLWLGAQLNKNLEKLDNWINRTPIYIWVILVIITFIFGMGEEVNLFYRDSIDPYNSLRITNIFYSIACFFLFFRIRKFDFLDWIKPRETTFGIYLIHFIIACSVLPEIFITLKRDVNILPLWQVMGYILLRFILIYGSTLLLVMGINKTKFKWSIGRS